MQGASEWQEVDAAEFPRTFPTTTLEILKGILYVQQVCVKGKVTELNTKVLDFENTPVQSRKFKVKAEESSKGTAQATDLSTAVLVEGEQSVNLECWAENHSLIKNIADGTALQINRVLWKVNEKKGGFVLRAIPNTSVIVLQAEAAEAVQAAASDAPIALSAKFDVGADRGWQSEGRAKVTSLSELLSLVDKGEPDKALSEDLWEVYWVHINELRSSKVDAEQMSYIGCKQCFSKDC